MIPAFPCDSRILSCSRERLSFAAFFVAALVSWPYPLPAQSSASRPHAPSPEARLGAINVPGVPPSSDGAAIPTDLPSWPEPATLLSNYRHNSPDDPARHVGMGDPLLGTSWRNRPLHVGWMFGGLFGDELVSGRYEQSASLIGGYRVGWDFDHYWGLEGRVHFSNADISSTTNPTESGVLHYSSWDANVVYYPWGDAHWRPYVALGMGWASFDARTSTGQVADESLFAIPLGAGLKYYWRNWLTLRLSLTDNWTIGDDSLGTRHLVSLTGDVEVHFGGRRVSYFPYQ